MKADVLKSQGRLSFNKVERIEGNSGLDLNLARLGQVRCYQKISMLARPVVLAFGGNLDM